MFHVMALPVEFGEVYQAEFGSLTYNSIYNVYYIKATSDVSHI